MRYSYLLCYCIQRKVASTHCVQITMRRKHLLSAWHALNNERRQV